MKNIIIIRWITNNEARSKEENGFGGLGGFFEKGMRWKDYKEQWIPGIHPMLETLRKSIVKNDIRWTGEEMQENGYDTVPLWSNGKVDTYSWRAWGDLMAAVWSEKENKDYSYIDFYM
ncbi:MAG: hypothetical protein ACYDIA_01910 [Candidatus Humimicrobiaceae bacterium]